MTKIEELEKRIEDLEKHIYHLTVKTWDIHKTLRFNYPFDLDTSLTVQYNGDLKCLKS